MKEKTYLRKSKELYHSGIKGQKWGIRRYQNPDGTLTEEGRIHYGVSERKAKTKVDKKVAKDFNTMTENQFKSKYYTSKKTYAKRFKKANGSPYSLGKQKSEKYEKILNLLGKPKIPYKKTANELNNELQNKTKKLNTKESNMLNKLQKKYDSFTEDDAVSGKIDKWEKSDEGKLFKALSVRNIDSHSEYINQGKRIVKKITFNDGSSAIVKGNY